MTSRALVEDFVAQRRLAVVGASRSGKKFGNAVVRELTAKGYAVTPVHPTAETIDGLPCASSLLGLHDAVDGVVVVVPPAHAVDVVHEAADAGIRRVWLQQGAGSPEALALAAEKGLSAVDGECILMFAEPVTSFHRFHRWVWNLLGKAPN